jgi:hypothetical protein
LVYGTRGVEVEREIEKPVRGDGVASDDLVSALESARNHERVGHAVHRDRRAFVEQEADLRVDAGRNAPVGQVQEDAVSQGE